MPELSRGRYRVALAQSEEEVQAAQRLRHLAFVATRGRGDEGLTDRDADDFDAGASHLLVWEGTRAVACCRLRLVSGADLLTTYAAQYYDLTALARGFPAPMLELGRFCLAPDCHDPDVLRLAWAGLTMVVDRAGAGLLFGCTSFAGADPQRHGAALAGLRPHLGPDRWRPGPKSAERVELSGLAAPFNPHQALAGLPPLLRSYLAMGGWVSDHAVIDRALDTLHVFTGVEVAAIPATRARALRAIAAGAGKELG